MLHEISYRLHLLQRCWRERGDVLDRLLDVRSYIPSALSEVEIPGTHLLPVGESFLSGPAGRKEGENHLAGNAGERRHINLFPDARDIAEGPIPLVAAGLRGLNLGMIEPRRAILPLLRQNQSVMLLDGG